MTDRERSELADIYRRLDAVEEDLSDLEGLPEKVAELAGTVKTLATLVTARFDRMEPNVEKAAGIKSAVQYAAIVIVPILLAIITGYFAIKSAQIGASK